MIAKESTPLEGVWKLHHRVVADERGGFMRWFCESDFERLGLVSRFPQINHSYCARRGILRGLHYQIAPAAETKVLTCVRGEIFDVIVDMRRGSPSFLQWFGITLRHAEAVSVYVPSGFAHGYQALTSDCAVMYASSAVYNPGCERLLAWNEPRVGIKWPVDQPTLSEKDRGIEWLAADFQGVSV